MMDEPKKRSALYIAKPLRWARQAWRGGSPWRASSFALTRKRSCLISCSQPAGGRIWNFGRQAGWNETERQARRIEGRCGRWNLGTTYRRHALFVCEGSPASPPIPDRAPS